MEVFFCKIHKNYKCDLLFAGKILHTVSLHLYEYMRNINPFFFNIKRAYKSFKPRNRIIDLYPNWTYIRVSAYCLVYFPAALRTRLRPITIRISRLFRSRATLIDFAIDAPAFSSSFFTYIFASRYFASRTLILAPDRPPNKTFCFLLSFSSVCLARCLPRGV